MLNILRAGDRGHTSHDGLDAYHTFSFADYYNPDYMEFRQLKAINEEIIQPLQGFPSHAHKDMEIIFYVVDGLLQYQDSMGANRVVHPGEFQHTTVGTGITHSEHNVSEQQPLHLIHIWIFPQQHNVAPSSQQISYEDKIVSGELCLLASPEGKKDSVIINQDANLYICRSNDTHNIDYQIAEHRHLWLQMVKGSVMLNGEKLDPGDGIGISDEAKISITTSAGSEFLLIDQC
ncbi:pirin family protein [Pseudomonadota bacterium]